jgi:hypothetical protein
MGGTLFIIYFQNKADVIRNYSSEQYKSIRAIYGCLKDILLVQEQIFCQLKQLRLNGLIQLNIFMVRQKSTS